jgi:4'-phosphopantetheinyl transferase
LQRFSSDEVVARFGTLLLVPSWFVPGDGNVGSCPGRPQLAFSGQVGSERLSLWLLDVEANLERSVDPSVLDDGERRHADALETPHLRERYQLAHAALRHLLGQAMGLPPQDVRIVRQACPRCGAAGGRPVLPNPTRPLHFSMSSSEHLVLLGLASVAVGVDVEKVPSLRAVDEAGEQLHPTERAELRSSAPEARQAVFTRLWSRKEAYLKGIGVGLGHGMAGEYLGTGPQPAAPYGWTLLDVAVPRGFVASAALKTRSGATGSPTLA